MQVLYSRARNRSFVAAQTGADPFGDAFPVTEYYLVDFISTVKVGPGTLRFGVENLLNEEYLTPARQIGFTNSFRFASRGATATLGYSFAY